MAEIKFSRVWAMPNSATFTIKPIKELVERNIAGKEVILDPFARECKYGTITARSTNARDEPKPASLVERTLNTKNTYRPHRGRGNHSDDNSFEYKVKDVYLYWKC